MDSGMTARLQPQRISTLEQAIETPVEAGMAAAAGLPGDGWSRVRAIGFGQGMPVPLAEALRACAPAGMRIEMAAIEMGAPAVGIVGARHGELHLVAVGGKDHSVNGLDGLAGVAGPTLAVCPSADEAMTMRALAAGADGVLYLRDGRDDLARALQAAASGAPALTATAARALIAHARDTTARPAPAAIGVAQGADEPPAAASPSPIRLTAREREIIMLADQGCTFTQAARRMGVQVSTVYTHVRRLYDKLSVNSLPQALHEARRAGLL